MTATSVKDNTVTLSLNKVLGTIAVTALVGFGGFVIDGVISNSQQKVINEKMTETLNKLNTTIARIEPIVTKLESQATQVKENKNRSEQNSYELIMLRNEVENLKNLN
ncbi:hypothetical protein SAMN05216480_12313 [Pustulibacterium marinum]|uniref:Uncharacterized protein n=1 Tax=Pustulibacterium marinum TaxID=1224947 RepID=A0A1I7IW01_9FLAO|nr:hypothetical protein [Pustulibacterium marinum]SFU77078.1 hypothetical protein SAMN05216480_12313 [Pustulibacterium marinum]